MAAYQGGNAAAFAPLFDRHAAAIKRFCFRQTRDAARADELTQEVFMRVVRTAPTWEPTARVRTWIFTIARNLCIDEARRGRKRQTVSLDEPRGEQGDTTLADQLRDRRAVSAAGAPVRSEFRLQLARGLELLPAEQREVFELRAWAELRFPEIASLLGVSENTIKSRFRYAAAALRASLRDLEGYSLDDADAADVGGHDD
jgi:RNA polymerase sigma-70 factor (ECF subfamily)